MDTQDQPVTAENKEAEVIEAEIVEEPNQPSPEEVTPEPSIDTPNEPEPSPTVEEERIEPQPDSTESIDQPLSENQNGTMTIRSDETGDKVYMLREKKRYWVKNTETLAKLGFYLGKEKRIPFSELLGYPEGEPIDMTVPDAIFPWDKPEGEKISQPSESSSVWQ